MLWPRVQGSVARATPCYAPGSQSSAVWMWHVRASPSES